MIKIIIALYSAHARDVHMQRWHARDVVHMMGISYAALADTISICIRGKEGLSLRIYSDIYYIYSIYAYRSYINISVNSIYSSLNQLSEHRLHDTTPRTDA